MRKIIIVILFIFIPIFLSNILVQADEFIYSYSQMNGNTTYIIQGDRYGGWKSELEFPLSVSLVSFKYKHNIKNISKRSYLNINLTKNISDKDAGIFKDYDWVYRYSDDVLIYSESKAELEALIYDINLETLLTEIDSGINLIFLKLGYRKMSYDYQIYDTFQENYLWGQNEEIYVEGKTLEYSVNYSIPYLGLKVRTPKKKLNYSFYLNYSPIVSAKDFDNHLLRNKISFIKADGSSYELSVFIEYKINSNLALSSFIKYFTIYTKGKQTQKNHNDLIISEGIDAELFSEQRRVALGITYKY